jgi:Family of unknown function (DUF5678)
MAIFNSPDHALQPPTLPGETGPRSALSKELADWNAHYQLLLTGKLSQYGGKFIVVRDGNVIAHGCDPEELRNNTSMLLGIVGDNLVVPFVDNNECLVAE